MEGKRNFGWFRNSLKMAFEEAIHSSVLIGAESVSVEERGKDSQPAECPQTGSIPEPEAKLALWFLHHTCALQSENC